MTLSLRRSVLPAIALLGVLQAPAQAIGRLADIQIVDRDSGETLPLHRHQGDYWVAGRPGARYAVALRNAQPARILGVVSVDGVNVVSGETAAWHQTGYVLGPWQPYDISGWRKSDAEVAVFRFAALPSSYAARTGRPTHVGVIGVALFQERVYSPEPAPSPWQKPRASNRTESPMRERNAAPASAVPQLGTAHGEREPDAVGHTTFERRSDRPDEMIRIRYDSLENLVAMGVLPAPMPRQPNPFPASRGQHEVPDLN